MNQRLPERGYGASPYNRRPLPLPRCAPEPLMAFDRLRLMQRAWRYRLRHDPAEIRFLLDTLGRGDAAIDVGAHKGAYTWWMARAVGRAGRVFAFEPQPELADRLRRQLTGPRWAHVSIEAAAVSEQAGQLDLYVPDDSPSPGASLETARSAGAKRTHRVRIVTLDGRIPAEVRVRFIKVDVEGHELSVFRGAQRLLTTDRPALLFECEARHHGGGAIASVFDHLRTLGYEGSFFWRGRRLPLDQFRAESHQVEGKEPYANNFAFTHPGGG